MATTARNVFDLAIGLMDEVDEDTGKTDTADNADYKQRTLFIINTLCGELYPLSDNYETRVSGRRSVCPTVTDFSSELPLDDVLARTVLPYGLAAHLLVDENTDSAGFMQQRYEELREMFRRGVPSRFESIEDVYGGIGSGEFSRW